MDRASASEAEGRRFESGSARQFAEITDVFVATFSGERVGNNRVTNGPTFLPFEGPEIPAPRDATPGRLGTNRTTRCPLWTCSHRFLEPKRGAPRLATGGSQGPAAAGRARGAGRHPRSSRGVHPERRLGAGNTMTIQVSINGFGRMGRLALRAAWGWPDPKVERLAKGACVIALTGYGHAQSRTRSQVVGFARHLVKPGEMLGSIVYAYRANASPFSGTPARRSSSTSACLPFVPCGPSRDRCAPSSCRRARSSRPPGSAQSSHSSRAHRVRS